jgi:hypothetical protein
MNRRVFSIAVLALALSCSRSQTVEPGESEARNPSLRFRLAYSLLVGGDGAEEFRDVAVAPDGTAFAVGRTSSVQLVESGVALRDRPAPPDRGETLSRSDVLVVRIAPDGKLGWMRSIGGPGVDLAYAVELAPDGDLIVAGRAGPGFPTTPGCAAPTFGGDAAPNEAYGAQDGFVAKLASATGDVLWATFVGGGDRGFVRDVDVDAEGNPVVAMADVDREAGWVPGPPPGGGDGVVAKLAADGSRVLWARYVGGALGRDDAIALRVAAPTGQVFAVGNTASPDIFGARGAASAFSGPPSESGNGDVMLLELTAAGDSVRGAYLGGSDEEGTGTHNIALGLDGRVVVGHWTFSGDLVLPDGGFQSAHRGGQSDAVLWRVGPTGIVEAGTYLGSSGGENIQGLAVDSEGRVYASVDSVVAEDFPVTTGAYRVTPAGAEDGVLAVLSPDLDQLLFSTRIGGSRSDRTRSLAVDPDGGVVLAGISSSPDWPVTHGDPGLRGSTDAIVLRFVRE